MDKNGQDPAPARRPEQPSSEELCTYPDCIKKCFGQNVTIKFPEPECPRGLPKVGGGEIK